MAPINHYVYFAAGDRGTFQQLPMQAFGPEPPTADQINAMYMQVASQAGLGVPRPTHYTETELHELPPMVESPDQPTAKRPMIIVPNRQNGAK